MEPLSALNISSDLTIFMKDSTSIPITQCISWCKDQHLARAYNNEWLIVMALMFLFCHYLIQFAERTTLIQIPEEYRKLISRLKSGSLTATSFLLIAYTYLLAQALG